jgi:Fe-S-cluster containining protein
MHDSDMPENAPTLREPPINDLMDAYRRRDEYSASLAESLREKEDRIAKEMRLTNSSAISKLTKIYALVDELGAAATGFVACRNACSSCCHMNVMISAVEAKQIEAATGRTRVALSSSRVHDMAEFSGQPCPFLKNASCSIYDVRPFACRKHVSFDTTSYWCHPERSHLREMPLMRFEGAEAAFFDVTERDKKGVFADIRDFFPPPTLKL